MTRAPVSEPAAVVNEHFEDDLVDDDDLAAVLEEPQGDPPQVPETSEGDTPDVG